MYSDVDVFSMRGWGTASFPNVSGEHLRVVEHLEHVPENGTVADIGAGIGLSLAAFVAVHRPDVSVVSLDAGYKSGDIEAGLSEGLRTTVESFDHPCQKLLLTHNRAWINPVTSTAEDLQLETGSVDLALSYACVPTLVTDPVCALREAVRVLRSEGQAVFGPTERQRDTDWFKALDSAQSSGLVSACNYWDAELINAYGDEVIATFTTVTK